MVHYEKDVCDYLRIPNLPKKGWNGKDSFTHGVAVLTLMSGQKAYGVVSFDNQRDEKPRVIKVFAPEPFTDIDTILVVPSYMDTPDPDTMDLDDESKKRVAELEKEAREAENDVDDVDALQVPENEYFFDHIHNDEEGRAYIEAWNKANKIRAGIPKKHESIVMRLGVIYADSMKRK